MSTMSKRFLQNPAACSQPVTATWTSSPAGGWEVLTVTRSVSPSMRHDCSYCCYPGWQKELIIRVSVLQVGDDAAEREADDNLVTDTGRPPPQGFYRLPSGGLACPAAGRSNGHDKDAPQLFESPLPPRSAASWRLLSSQWSKTGEMRRLHPVTDGLTDQCGVFEDLLRSDRRPDLTAISWIRHLLSPSASAPWSWSSCSQFTASWSCMLSAYLALFRASGCLSHPHLTLGVPGDVTQHVSVHSASHRMFLTIIFLSHDCYPVFLVKINKTV